MLHFCATKKKKENLYTENGRAAAAAAAASGFGAAFGATQTEKSRKTNKLSQRFKPIGEFYFNKVITVGGKNIWEGGAYGKEV